MDFHALTRKELQKLCKSSGIPANRSNVFMADALAKMRIPLSQMDANKEQTNGLSTKSSLKQVASTGIPFTAPLTKKANIELDGLCSVSKSPYVNNFLRKGKRKDFPASQSSETHCEGKGKIHNTTKSTTNALKRSDAVSAQEKVKAEIIAAPSFPDLTRNAKPGAINNLKSGAHHVTAAQEAAQLTMEIVAAPMSHDLTDAAKERIVNKVRSQIDASLCSKVMNPLTRRSTETLHLGSPERLLESKMGPASSEVLNLTLEYPKQPKENFPSAVPSAGKTTSRGEDILGATASQRATSSELICSSPPVSFSPAGKTTLRGEDILGATASHRATSSELICSSPPVSFSPLVRRVEERIRSVVDRVQGFWGARDLAAENSVDSLV